MNNKALSARDQLFRPRVGMKVQLLFKIRDWSAGTIGTVYHKKDGRFGVNPDEAPNTSLWGNTGHFRRILPGLDWNIPPEGGWIARWRREESELAQMFRRLNRSAPKKNEWVFLRSDPRVCGKVFWRQDFQEDAAIRVGFKAEDHADASFVPSDEVVRLFTNRKSTAFKRLVARREMPLPWRDVSSYHTHPLDSEILDLFCPKGELISHLRGQKQISGFERKFGLR